MRNEHCYSGFRAGIEVTAIVSTYASESFMRGCLEDLVGQTLFEKGMLEILVIDCASPENEAQIVREFQEQYSNISYVRISERETLAGAWNIGARYAHGDFLTNANTDDRHHPECLEKLMKALKEHPEAHLAFANVYQSRIPNESFEDNQKDVVYRYKPYFAPEVFLHYQFGCQPLWRASVHEIAGYFNRDLRAASDYEFNYRFALAGCRAHHVDETLGSFLERDNSLSLADTTSLEEQAALREQYAMPDKILELYEMEGYDVSTDEAKVAVFHDISLRALSIRYPWRPGHIDSDPDLALIAISAAIAIDSKNITLMNNFAVALQQIEREDDARLVLESARALLELYGSEQGEASLSYNLRQLALSCWNDVQLEPCVTL